MTTRDEHTEVVLTAQRDVQAGRAALAASVERRAAVLRGAHDSGMSWKELGAELGITAQRAHQLGTEPTTRAEQRVPLSKRPTSGR